MKNIHKEEMFTRKEGMSSKAKMDRGEAFFPPKEVEVCRSMKNIDKMNGLDLFPGEGHLKLDRIGLR